MTFSFGYFTKYKVEATIFSDAPKTNTGIIVVIPCYDDPAIFNTLKSLDSANKPGCSVEVIVIVNSSVSTPQSIIDTNRKIYNNLKNETANYNNFNLLVYNLENLSKKTAGVGKARKTGMDEAVRRFTHLNNPNGIIASLDADTLVHKEYLQCIEKQFAENPKTGALTIQFQHNYDPALYSMDEINACILYEIYLRYVRLSLQYAGFPYSMHTIGSCFAINAETYVKTGGMPCKQGGEDFYFLHKVAPVTDIKNTNKILVYPAPRISDRVPFGTGPSIKNIIKDKKYDVYNFELFVILKKFISILKHFSKSGEYLIDDIPAEIIEYAGKENIMALFEECRKNAKPGKNLLKRLFFRFDAFFIIKWLNSFNQSKNYPPVDVTDAAELLFYKHNIRPDNENITSLYDEILKLDLQ